ncbi:MAG: PIG-L family deacetylase [Acidobacteria bacterium]|nr:PIG-L family deacetylase [Acidobacteriota bacterium]MCA1611364.1 PIG-L family deacetylase [Acidobacteriota bacterium]
MGKPLDEASLIPYQASELVAGRLLVLGAHPDDDAFGAGGTLALNASAKALRVWIATDGTRQQGVAPDAAESYGRLRREEARRAAYALGIPAPVFAGLPDRGLADRRGDLDAALAAQIAEVQPELVLCPSPVEIHPDHRALAEALIERVAASRPEDPDHDLYRFLQIAFYEISHPILPNVLVDISAAEERKREALAAFVSQQEVRDYASAVTGLNAYRRLTLSGSGPVEAFRLIPYALLSTLSLESFRRSIGPSANTEGSRPQVPVSVVVRTRNRPALLREALESLKAQTARPRQVMVVNDGGAPLGNLDEYRQAWDLVVEEFPERRGRSAAANRGVALATSELIGFLDDDDLLAPDHFERLSRAWASGPEPVVYSDAVTAVYTAGDEGWTPGHRGVQYSLDYDPDYLLLANYIPLHTLLLPRSLFLQAGGFDETINYSEDWDFLIRLSALTGFRHVRAITCEYRQFQDENGESGHVPAGAAAFQEARQRIYARYARRRTEAGLARVFDRMRAQMVFWYERDFGSQGELAYQRESHRRLSERAAAGDAARLDLREEKRRVSELQTERARLMAENELVHARLADVFDANERYDRELSKMRTEVERLGGILEQIYASRMWHLHLLVDRLRGRR